MAEKKFNRTADFQIEKPPDGGLILIFTGKLTIESCADLLDRIPETLQQQKIPSTITLDLSGVTGADDYGVLVINEIREFATQHNSRIKLIHVNDTVEKVFSLFKNTPVSQTRSDSGSRLNPAQLVSDVGRSAIYGMRKADSSISFLGSTLFALGAAVKNPRSVRFQDIIDLIRRGGVEAIPIVGLVSMIIGLILAFIASVQLEQFGGQIFIPAMITFAMVAEIGPIMTAIVIAGRTGSAYAAEIGTMKISEEIDALTSMGFLPALFLVIPRILALLVALPILTMFAAIAAIIGGFIVCVTMMGLMAGPYLQGVSDALFLDDLLWGLTKSCIFAVLIALVGCLRGFQVRGGAAAVGNAATSAVVSSIFLIILVDSVCAIIRMYWG